MPADLRSKRVSPALLKAFPKMNDAQRAIVGHTDGPRLVIAGPGSGKTFSLVLRTLNLLLLGKALPRELVICTFTENAAFELRDRISAAVRKVPMVRECPSDAILRERIGGC